MSVLLYFAKQKKTGPREPGREYSGVYDGYDGVEDYDPVLRDHCRLVEARAERKPFPAHLLGTGGPPGNIPG
jgi:hypothetical protein